MKRSLILLLVMTGCANDHYVPNDNGMNTALQACKKEANDKFYAENSPLGGAGGVAAGVLGGAIGGAFIGAVSAASAPETSMKANDINPYTENCMANKGYQGTSK